MATTNYNTITVGRDSMTISPRKSVNSDSVNNRMDRGFRIFSEG